MEQYQLLRIYFKYGQKSKKLSFWQKLWNSSLSDQLLKAAKAQKIHHANIFIASAGYLNGGNIVYNVSELPPPKNTACLELIDEELKLQTFLKDNEAEIQEAISILIHPEIQLIK
ncbi:hypothetical protein [Empedobacter tilapiae]|uniref:DUF190 domain-containing protein n=1 Tax=Empedobacter tilapiae TaxID=2491114 RepID=A0A4Z1BJ29_9FLAO|nr:hypothetical protein [Empedobacter tilapiae]TGN29531.1 hypothetical protein E4J94_02160 [Empedobacter tilapiae]